MVVEKKYFGTLMLFLCCKLRGDGGCDGSCFCKIMLDTNLEIKNKTKNYGF